LLGRAYKLWLRRREQYQAIIASLRKDTHCRRLFDIKHYRVPAPGLSFSAPNLPFVIREVGAILPQA